MLQVCIQAFSKLWTLIGTCMLLSGRDQLAGMGPSIQGGNTCSMQQAINT